MKRNFQLNQGNELLLGGRSFDLHNHYDFAALVIAYERCVQLWFTPNPEHGRAKAAVVLEVRAVDILETTQGVNLGLVRDLEEVGYKGPPDVDLDWLAGESRAQPEDHLIFLFGANEYIRIHGESAELREEASVPSFIVGQALPRQ